MYPLLLFLLIPKAIKAYGISAAVYDVYISLFDTMGLNFSLLLYTLLIEGLFVALKSAHYQVPEWFEAMEDVL